jgi:hypothetical protein
MSPIGPTISVRKVPGAGASAKKSQTNERARGTAVFLMILSSPVIRRAPDFSFWFPIAPRMT